MHVPKILLKNSVCRTALDYMNSCFRTSFKSKLALLHSSSAISFKFTLSSLFRPETMINNVQMATVLHIHSHFSFISPEGTLNAEQIFVKQPSFMEYLTSHFIQCIYVNRSLKY